MKTNLAKSANTRLLACSLSLLCALNLAQAQTYYVAGDVINGWGGPAGSLMVGGPAVYTNVVTTGTAGSYEQFKVTDGTWNNTWPGQNVLAKFDAGGQNTIYFFPGTFSDGWFPKVNRVGYADPGNMAWEVTGDFTTPAWDSDPAAQLVSAGNGVYTNTYTIATAGTYGFKFRTPNTWAEVNFGADFGNGSGNASFTTVNANEPVLFKLDLPNGRFQIVVPPVTNQVVFAVDMSSQMRIGYFQPGSSVFVSGDFNGWPGTGTGALALTNYPPYKGGSNTNIYYGTNTFTGIPNSAGADYKFTDNDPGLPAGYNGYEQAGNRSFSLLTTNGLLLLPVVRFGNYDVLEYLAAVTPVFFSVNMTNALGIDAHVFDANADSVYINGQFANYNSNSGSWYPWSAAAPAGYQMIRQGSTLIYTNTINIPAGTPVGFEYKYGMDTNNTYSGPADDEAGFLTNRFRVVRSTALNPYPMPMDTFGNVHVEPLFGDNSTAAAGLTVGNPSGGSVPVNWLGRPGAHLQVRTDFSSGAWQDVIETDGTNWSTGYFSTNGLVSQTNWPASGKAFFRLVKPN